MTLEQAKHELIKRYKYLYKNAYFVLAPYIDEEISEVYPKVNLFEEFLLSDKPMEDSNLYKNIEAKKNDKDYVADVKTKIELLEKESNNETFHYVIDIWKILDKTWDYIKGQTGDLVNKKNKLNVLDEYYRLRRYQNDGMIHTSGKELDFHDCNSLILEKDTREPFRNYKDIGIKKNSFIKAISSAPKYTYNSSIFTEGEKQLVYLEYHEELPCDLEITCQIEEEYFKTVLDERLPRPENTSPCGENFIIKEEEIFVKPDQKLYRYYQLCPQCGYMVNIPQEILPEKVKQRIEERCSKDDKLFRKMYLYSELFSLDKSSKIGQRRLLKKEK